MSIEKRSSMAGSPVSCKEPASAAPAGGDAASAEAGTSPQAESVSRRQRNMKLSLVYFKEKPFLRKTERDGVKRSLWEKVSLDQLKLTTMGR